MNKALESNLKWWIYVAKKQGCKTKKEVCEHLQHYNFTTCICGLDLRKFRLKKED